MKRDNGTYLLDGGVSVQEVNDRLDTDFEGDDVETIGGYVFSLLGRAPEAGDQIERLGYVLLVEAVEDARIDRLVIQQVQSANGTSDE